MSKCDYCDRQGWPTLDGMCERHYQNLVVYSLAHAVWRANQEWMEAIEKVYKVEMALGLRSRMAEDTQSDLEAGKRRSAPSSGRSAMKRVPTSRNDEEVII